MQQFWGRRSGSRGVRLFFSGWGSEQGLFPGVVGDGTDTLLLFHYDSFDWDGCVPDHYEWIDIAAWSLGVWVAEILMEPYREKIRRSVAVNGTPWPISRQFGIAESVFEATWRSLDEANRRKFIRRMCGDTKTETCYGNRTGERSVQDLAKELQFLYYAILEEKEHEGLDWTYAFGGRQDRIILPENQSAAWKRKGTRFRLVDMPHYPQELLDDLWVGKWEKWINI